ncbi:MAG: hypothetical protein ABW352_13750 [Polyangiales bacterium]
MSILLAGCGDDDGGSRDDGSGVDAGQDAGRDAGIDSALGRDEAGTQKPAARIQTQVTAAGGAPASNAKLRGGAATIESLKYYITSISICEQIDAQGSGFANPRGCLQLYSRNIGELAYDTRQDYRPLGDIARRSDEGFIDLMSASSRAALATSTSLSVNDVRSYNFGVINWALPVKLRATVPFTDGTTLYTHDGVSSVELVGADMFRAYYTAPSTPLDQAPAEDAVVLLGNGGNWFKFQSPLTISAADIEAQRAYVLDLVFNPEGIVNGYAGSGAIGNLSQRDTNGNHIYDVTVPLLDLAPVPHRADQRVLRESYRGTASLDGSSFDLRVELYTVEGEDVVYGADLKTLVNAGSTQPPPSVIKASYIDRESDGTLTISSYKHLPALRGLRRPAEVGGTTRISVSCGEHTDRAAAEGGTAVVVNRCPGASFDVTLTLTSRNAVEGSIPITGDAGVVDSGTVADASSLLDAN